MNNILCTYIVVGIIIGSARLQQFESNGGVFTVHIYENSCEYTYLPCLKCRRVK